MDTPEVIQLIILVVLLMLSAFFSSAETALTCVNKVKMKTLADEGNKNAKRVLDILESPGKMLSTILIGNNLVNISTTSLATTLTIKVFGSVFVGVATGILTILILLFGEIVPKTAASINSEKLALTYSPLIKALMFVLTPVIFIVDKLSGVLLKLMHINANGTYNPMTESELKTYVEVSHEDGAIESEEREMILNVFDLGDSLARDIMIPRIEMTMVDVDTSYTKLQNLFKNTLYSRIPVYEEDKDHIIGSVTLKDFFLVSKKSDFNVRNIMRDIYYTYETKKTDDLLIEMRESANNIAVVLDEYGAAVGLITLEDLLEEIVGEIRDEYDEEEEELLKEIDTRTYDIAGSMKLDDINDALLTSFDSDDYDSIGGIMIEHLDHIPKKGESVTLEDGTVITASIMNKNRIMRVTVVLPEKSDENGKENEETMEVPNKEESSSDTSSMESSSDKKSSHEEEAFGS
ncbi:MAG: HlyC/CorC family transporter [Lachnospiraceae bacterium]|nr:HlyC/CorC family transporter [Lachnospiraceae bacterium]